MTQKKRLYVVAEKALPEVLLKVVEAKKLLETEQVSTVQEATEKVGISRSSFYKYKEDIVPFHEDTRGKTVTFMMQMDDKPGLLSDVLKIIAQYHANILTIHQTVPVNGVASLTLSIDLSPNGEDPMSMFGELEGLAGIHYLKILARE